MLDLRTGEGMLLLGAAVLALGVYDVLRARRSRPWSTVIGEILDSEVVNRGSSFFPEWLAQVRYRYAVDGRTYESGRIRLHDPNQRRLRWPAARDCARYPIGAKPQVYVSPDDPAVAVLEPAGSPRRFGNVIVGGLVMAYGAFELFR
jgi:hypothetical protein